MADQLGASAPNIARLRHDVRMGRLLPLFAFVDLALVIVALIDCLSTDNVLIRALPKVVWVFLILLFSPVGPIVWFVAGRPVSPATSTATGGLGRPGNAGQRGRPRPLAPDDDPEFLASLAKRHKEDEKLLQMWEADLRRREEELRRTGSGPAKAPQEGDISRDRPAEPGDGDERPSGASGPA